MRFRITCTNKREKHEGVISVGCYDTQNNHHILSESEAIDRLENRGDTFYVERPNLHIVEVGVETVRGEKFLRTEPDGERLNNLDWLPECSSRPKIIVPPRTVFPAASHGTNLLWWC